MRKYSAKELAKRIVKYDVLPIFKPDCNAMDEQGWWEWLEKTIQDRLENELDIRTVKR